MLVSARFSIIWFCFFCFQLQVLGQTEQDRIEQIQNMEIAPNFMGPNALPVPEITKGRLTPGARLEFGLQAHFSDGDNTQNLFTNFYYSLLDARIGIHVLFVPVEFFQMTESERLRRNIEEEFFEPDGTQTGDVYYGFEVQVIRDRKNWPDIMIRGSVKTASGENVENGRFTDSPGYYFDASFGKSILLKENKEIRPYAMLGFYSWQTYDVINPQNDATVYGLGVDYQSDPYLISLSTAGYAGWKQNGDKPLVIRSELGRRMNRFTASVGYQIGLQDFPFQTVQFSLEYNFIKDNN
jgi:hypothetical protein